MTTATPTTLDTAVAAIVQVLRSKRWPLNSEKATQAAIAEALTAAGIDHSREHRLSAGDVPDFFCGGAGIAIEVKLRAPKTAIYRQCKRYCEHEDVTAIILATATAIGWPQEIEGKPAYLVSLGSAWL